MGFTMHYSEVEVSFLDTLVKINDQGLLEIDLYRKPTDRNGLLHFANNHPEATKRSLPCSQFKRVERIVSDPIVQSKRLDEMSAKFNQHNYPDKLLKDERARMTKPSTPRVHKSKRIACVTLSYPRFNNA